MPSVEQNPVTNSNGVILSVGVVVNNDRCTITLPLAHDASSDLTLVTQCSDAVNTFVAHGLPLLLPCMTSDAYVSYCQAEGMIDGNIPSRADYTPTTYMGGDVPGAMPSTVAGLVINYGDPDDIPPGKKRVRVGKTFIPGTSQSGWVGDAAEVTLEGNMLIFGEALQNGMVSSLAGSSVKWWRVLAVPLPRSTFPVQCARVSLTLARDYVATQRRRAVPH